MLQYKLCKLLNTGTTLIISPPNCGYYTVLVRGLGVYSNTGACVKVITKANNILNGISSSTVCTEVIQSAQGMEYLLGRQLHTHTRAQTYI